MLKERKKEEQTEICSSYEFALFYKAFYCIKVLTKVSLKKPPKCLPVSCFVAVGRANLVFT